MTYEKLIKSEDFYPHHFELYKEYGQPIRCRYQIEKFHERFGDGYKVYELFPKQVENEGFITYQVIYYCKFKSNIGETKRSIKMNTPKKYIHKPTEVEAVKVSRSMQLTDDFKKYVTCELAPVKRGKNIVYTMALKTPEGIMGAEEGDYLVKGVKGEVYPVKKEIFEEIYEEMR